MFHEAGVNIDVVGGFFCIGCKLVYRATQLAACTECRRSVCPARKCYSHDGNVYLVERPGLLLPADTDLDDFKQRVLEIMDFPTLRAFFQELPENITLEKDTFTLLAVVLRRPWPGSPLERQWSQSTVARRKRQLTF